MKDATLFAEFSLAIWRAPQQGVRVWREWFFQNRMPALRAWFLREATAHSADAQATAVPPETAAQKITRLLAIVEISRPAGARPARRDRRPSEPPCATAPRRRRQPDFPRRFALRWLQAKHAALQATISAAPQPLANTLPEIPATPTASARPAPRPQWLQKIFQEEESGQAFSLAGIAPVDPYGPIWFTCWDVLETYLTREGLIRQTLAGDARREAERPSVSPYREDDSPYGGKSGALARLMASRDAALKAGVIFPARRRRAFMEILQSRSPPEEAL